jgi:NAD(P)-binding Rossmann-like domain
MNTSPLSADYVIVGAGAVGMAFADTLVTETSARVVIVDRRPRPGGHWNDAYPFVRLHGPSATYGVNSLALGSGRIDTEGLNEGLNELASGDEICAYYDRVMGERLLASGRVTYLPQHDLGAHGVATSLRDGRRLQLLARRRWVDATQADTQVPATHPPRFALAPGVLCLTPTELTQRRPSDCRGHVIVGAGKTAIDTALWLLAQGVDPDTITWIRPREAWLLNRANVQPTAAFAPRVLAAMTAEFEAARDAESLDDLFARLEDADLLRRIDRSVPPTMYRCAIVSDAELAQLRRIDRVVRLGRVRAIEAHRIVLDRGEVATTREHVHVHCSAGGLPRGPMQPVFQGNRIVPQYVRRCSPSFSAAFIAHVEASFDDDEERNALCQPVPVPEVPLDWLRIHVHTARNQRQWAQHPQLRAWLRHSRLEAYTGALEAAALHGDATWLALQARLTAARAPGLSRLADLLGTAPQATATAAPHTPQAQRPDGPVSGLARAARRPAALPSGA